MKKVKVSGEVVIKDNGAQRVDWYEREFDLDDAVEGVAMARAVVRKALIGNELQRTIPGYKRVRTMQVDSLESVPGKKEGGGRLEQLVVEAVKADVMPENLDMYGSDKSKEMAVQSALDRNAERKKRVRKREAVDVVDEGYVD